MSEKILCITGKCNAKLKKLWYTNEKNYNINQKRVPQRKDF